MKGEASEGKEMATTRERLLVLGFWGSGVSAWRSTSQGLDMFPIRLRRVLRVNYQRLTSCTALSASVIQHKPAYAGDRWRSLRQQTMPD